MRCVDKNQQLKVYYKAHALATGQNVTFTLWSGDGNVLVNNSPGVEIGTDGVYYVDYTPTFDGYVLSLASNAGDRPEAKVFKCGTPTTLKAFYVQGGFKENKIIAYEIYDSTAGIIDSGNLDNIAGGFYSADVTSLATPWFFEVPPQAQKNEACL